jgi:hypothetical protein
MKRTEATKFIPPKHSSPPSKRELPFGSARKPKRTINLSLENSTDCKKTLAKVTTIKPTSSKADAREKLERDCFSELSRYRSEIMRSRGLDSASVASDACLSRLVGVLPMKLAVVASIISECGGINDPDIHQRLIDIISPYRSKSRELKNRYYLGR